MVRDGQVRVFAGRSRMYADLDSPTSRSLSKIRRSLDSRESKTDDAIGPDASMSGARYSNFGERAENGVYQSVFCVFAAAKTERSHLD